MYIIKTALQRHSFNSNVKDRLILRSYCESLSLHNWGVNTFLLYTLRNSPLNGLITLKQEAEHSETK
jgi:hypothetical protein